MTMPPVYLIAYDIGDPRRLGRVHRFLKVRALPIQFSVFLVRCQPEAIEQMAAHLAELIDPRQDDIRIYRLPERCNPRILGRPILPDGIFLAAHPTFSKLQPAAIQLPFLDAPNLTASPAAPSSIMTSKPPPFEPTP